MNNTTKKILSFILCVVVGIAVWFLPLQFLGLNDAVFGIHYFAAFLVFVSLLGVFRLIPALFAVLISALVFRALFN